MSDERSDAQTGEPMRLGERPADDEVAASIERFANLGAAAEIRVGLVDEHDRLRCIPAMVSIAPGGIGNPVGLLGSVR